ncbi:MAG: mechanosensitive ion channel family protein [Pseudomonadales bacterium]|nr:mechanosensitive ion channel family protein [Pseudomonadales bacterium]
MDFLLQWFESHYVTVVEVFVVVFIALAANFIIQRSLKGLSTQLQKTDTPWDDALTDAASKPIAWCVALYGLSFSVHIIERGQIQNGLLTQLDHYRDIAVLGLIGWFIVRFIKHAEVILIQANKYDQTTIIATTRLLRATVIITFSLFVLQALGYSVQGVMAFGGIGGIAIGFAAQDLLANFFGGLMIYMDRPFSVGEWIRSPDREIEGTVEHIGWRLTVIRTFDKRPLYVPNSVFAKIAIENPSRMTNRRIYETIGIRYDDAAKLKVIVADVRAMLEQHKDIDQNQTLIVNLNAFASSSLDFFIYTFTRTTNWIQFHQVKQDVLMQVMDIVMSHGAEMAFPTSTIHMPHQDALSKLDEAALAVNPNS